MRDRIPHLLQRREIASGEGWCASDVICTAGPYDRPYEESHTRPCIAIVAAGTFQYRCLGSPDLMVPGAILLGNAGACFTCGHEHGAGDRCISFSYDSDFFERLAHDARGAFARFKAASLPPIRVLAPVVAKASALLASADRGRCEELAVEVAARIMQIESGIERNRSGGDPASAARVSRVIRTIENEPDLPADLAGLARIARLSPYHFIRTFRSLTGMTPHRYLLCLKLRRAAVRLVSEKRKIADIALDCGFGDISNFNRAFKAEFGMSPRAYRRTA